MNDLLLMATVIMAAIAVVLTYLSNYYYKQLKNLRERVEYKALAEIGFLARLSRVCKLTQIHPNEHVQAVGDAIEQLAEKYSAVLKGGSYD